MERLSNKYWFSTTRILKIQNNMYKPNECTNYYKLCMNRTICRPKCQLTNKVSLCIMDVQENLDIQIIFVAARIKLSLEIEFIGDW